MAEELKSTIGFEASQAISTLAKLDASLAGYTQSITAAAGATSGFNAAAQKTDAAVKSGERSTEQQTAAMRKLDKAANKSKTVLISWQSVIRVGLLQVAHQAVSRFTSAITGSVQAAIDLEIALAEIQTIAPTLQDNFDGVAESVLRLSNQFGIASGVVAEGVYETLSNQIAHGADAFQFFASAAELSIGAVMGADSAVNLLSSVINSFGYNATQATMISGKLFRTIDLGRVRGEEFANTYGKIAVLAGQLGVTFDELNAAIATSTVTGIKYNEAATYIRNTMLKLLKPTDELKRIMKEMGVASAEAGIQAYTYAGFLQKIREEGGETATAMGKVFGRVRAIQGILLQTGPQFEKMMKNVKALQEAGEEDILLAKDIIFRTNAKQVQIELNAMKNTIVFGFGRQALQVLNDFFTTVASGTAVIKALGTSVLTAGAGFTGLLAVAHPVAAGIMATAAAVGFITLKVAEFYETVEDKQKQRELVSEKELASLLMRESQKVEDKIKKLKTVYSAHQRAVIAFQKQINAERDIAVDTEKFIGDAFISQLEKKKSALAAYLTAVEGIAKQAAENILKSEEKIFDVKKKIAALAFKTATRGASDAFKSQKANEQSRRLLQSAIEAFKSGKQDRAAALFSDAEAMAEMAATSAEAAGSTIRLQNAESVLSHIYQTQIRLQNELQRKEKERAALAEKSAQRWTASYNKIAHAISKIKEARIFGADGKMKFATPEEYKKATEKWQKVITEEFAKMGAEMPVAIKLGLMGEAEDVLKPVRDTLTGKPVSIKFVFDQYNEAVFRKTFGILDEMDKRTKMAFKLVGLEETLVNLQKLPQALVDAQKVMEAGLRKGLDETVMEARLDKSRANITALFKDMGAGFTWAMKPMEIIQVAFEKLFEQPKKGTPHYEELKTSFKGISDEAQKFVDMMSAGDFDEIQAKAIFGTMQALANQAKTLGNEKAVANVETLIGVLKEFGEIALNTQVLKEMGTSVDDEFQKIMQSSTKAGTQIGVTMVQGSETAINGFAMMESQFKLHTSVMRQDAITTASVIAQMGAAAARKPTVKQQFGNVVHRALGGDTIPAMLTPGEFVTNAASSRKFFSQLTAINADQKPVFRNQGGDTTTIGNVSFTVNDSGAPKQTAREIMSLFKREMRRGSVKL